MITRAPRLPSRKRDKLIECFVYDLNATQAAAIAKVSRPCANRWYRHFRELIYIDTRRAPRFTGEVEMDIGFFSGHSGKRTSALVRRLAGLPPARIVALRRAIKKAENRKVMVFGFLQRGGDVYLHPIKRKDRTALESVVRLVVERGATVYSDMEMGLSKLSLDGYRHLRINHSLEYALKGGVHINGMESFWREAKRALSRNFKGIPRTTLMLHIKERQWRYNTVDLMKSLVNLVEADSSSPRAKVRALRR